MRVVTKDTTPATGIKRKQEVDNSFNKKRKLEDGTNGGANGGAGTKVRVGNLAFIMEGKAEEIKTLFAECGAIKNVEMITRRDGSFAGVAIIDFEDGAGAAKALEYHDQDLQGRKMNITLATEERAGASFGGQMKDLTEKPPGCTTVFIGNLSFAITEEQVKEFFADCGDIKQCRWPAGDFTGIGWVEFFDTNAPDLAVVKRGQSILGRPIRVDYAAERKPRPQQW